MWRFLLGTTYYLKICLVVFSAQGPDDNIQTQDIDLNIKVNKNINGEELVFRRVSIFQGATFVKFKELPQDQATLPMALA